MRETSNAFPAVAATGAKVLHVSEDGEFVRVALPLLETTTNFFGTIFGGAMYAAADPWFIVKFLQGLRPGDTVLDEARAITQLEIGRSTLTLDFHVVSGDIAAVKAALNHTPKLTRDYSVDLIDEEGRSSR